MRLQILLLTAAAATLGNSAAIAEDTPLAIETDVRGDYFLVEKGDNDGKPTLLVKRVLDGYNHFVKREFDCAARTVRYLGEGESLDEIAAAQADTEAYQIEEGTIPDQLARLVCPSE